MADLPLGPIADAAERDPAGVALVDAGSVRTWTQVAAELSGAASAMLAGAPDPDQRWGVLGDNASPTLLAHAAGLMAGVGTVAVSRQLTLPELTDQVEDSAMVGLVAGPGGAATAVAALEAGLVGTVVLHSGADLDLDPSWPDDVGGLDRLGAGPRRRPRPPGASGDGLHVRHHGPGSRHPDQVGAGPGGEPSRVPRPAPRAGAVPGGPAHRRGSPAAQRPAHGGAAPPAGAARHHRRQVRRRCCARASSTSTA